MRIVHARRLQAASPPDRHRLAVLALGRRLVRRGLCRFCNAHVAAGCVTEAAADPGKAVRKLSGLSQWARQKRGSDEFTLLFTTACVIWCLEPLEVVAPTRQKWGFRITAGDTVIYYNMFSVRSVPVSCSANDTYGRRHWSPNPTDSALGAKPAATVWQTLQLGRLSPGRRRWKDAACAWILMNRHQGSCSRRGGCT